MTRRFANRLAMAGLLFALSCSGSNNVTLLGVTYTLQGVVADAVTGQRIGGDLKMYLIQGPEVRGPSRLITGSNDPLQGEYAFTGIPVEFADASNNVWKVVVIKQGYQRFEAEIRFFASWLSLNQTNAMLDAAYSRIGNIYLFPTGASAPDYSFTLTYNGKPVPNATVQLDPISNANETTFTASPFNSTLFATTGYVASLSATTDTNGVARFAGNLLSLGAFYQVQVLPVSFKEASTAAIPLALNVPTSITPGLDNVDQRIALTDLVPGAGNVPLYVTNESNLFSGVLQPNGSLVITFNIPVNISSLDGYNATLNPGVTATGAAGTGALSTTKPVNATLSTDGLTLTLAPNYATPPAGTERGLAISYAEGPAGGAPAGVTFPRIQPRDYPALSFNLFNTVGVPGGVTRLRLSNNAFVNPNVQMTAP